MMITRVSSREFNQDVSAAKKAARQGPVFITDRGRPAHVLLSIEAYQAMLGPQSGIIEMLALPGVEDIAFEPGRVGDLHRPADFD